MEVWRPCTCRVPHIGYRFTGPDPVAIVFQQCAVVFIYGNDIAWVLHRNHIAVVSGESCKEHRSVRSRFDNVVYIACDIYPYVTLFAVVGCNDFTFDRWEEQLPAAWVLLWAASRLLFTVSLRCFRHIFT